MPRSLGGVCCAVATPYNSDLSVDHAALASHCAELLRDGCNGLAVLGTTGEANSLSTRERMELLEALIKAGIPAEKLLPGTGVCSFVETVELTSHAHSLGVAGVLMLPPYYYKSPSDDGLIAAYSAVVDRLGDNVPKIIFYHIPQMSSVPISFELIETLTNTYPKVFCGIKDSAGDFEHMKATREKFPELKVFSGADPLMLPLLEAGGAGCITAASNLVASELAEVYRLFADATQVDTVARSQEKIISAREMTNSGPQIATIKAMLARRYDYEGWARIRPPHLPLSADALKTLPKIDC